MSTPHPAESSEPLRRWLVRRGHATRTPLVLAALAVGAAAASLAGCEKTEAPPATSEAPSPAVAADQAAPTSARIEVPPGDGPVAQVDGVDIPRDAFNREFRQTLDRYERARHDVKPALVERLKDNIVRRLVDQEILAQKAKSLGIQVDPEQLEAKWAEHKKRYGSEEAFAAFLERAGTTAQDVRNNFESNHLREAVFARVAEDVVVSGEEVRAFFEENRARYDEPEMIRASHILIRVPPDATEAVVAEKRQKAGDIRKQAVKKGADFAALAKEHGEDPTNTRGGDLGYFPKGRMVKPFEEAAWRLKIGQVSKLVRTQFGFHIIKKTDRKPASKKKLADVADQIERALLARKRNQAIREALEKWKQDAKVEIFVKGDAQVINAAYDQKRMGIGPRTGPVPLELPNGPAPGSPAPAEGTFEPTKAP